MPMNVSVSDEMKKLKELLDNGVLTQAEFDNEKAKLLNYNQAETNNDSHTSNHFHMICPRCGSTHISVQAVANIYTKHRGCLAWLLWIILACLTFGIILIWPLLTNMKVKSQINTEAVCQSCGNRWSINKPKKIAPIVIGIIIWLIIISALI
ncbi:MAG: SHOCT domain-containing protein [Clostridiales Family XIII bacterium]|nr:SHOCT domain-containing protein [Clostridiales Family XIII bacterium]